MAKPGKVYLIGCGPGDLELLTLKAVRCLGLADVILLDSLANPDVLQYASPNVQVIDVGKRGGRASTSQHWIEQQMITLATQGLTVARVKGGDPIVFARGGEELETLRSAGIDVEVVSGITSGIGVPAALGIPLTHRDYSSQIIFIAGYGFGEDKEPVLPEMNSFNGTLVIYMGLSKAREIADSLIAKGLCKDTPTAAIHGGTTDQQKFVFATLHDLPDAVTEANLTSPVLIVIGEVVRLSPHFSTHQARQRITK